MSLKPSKQERYLDITYKNSNAETVAAGGTFVPTFVKVGSDDLTNYEPMSLIRFGFTGVTALTYRVVDITDLTEWRIDNPTSSSKAIGANNVVIIIRYKHK